MNYREEEFKRRFASAAQLLSANPDQIVSLKLRESASYNSYRELVDSLRHETALNCSDTKLGSGENGYIIGHGRTRVIVVEHETGLEILYIAGSIASLIGLVPLVLQGWRAIRAHSSPRDVGLDHGVEFRQLDSSGHLVENRVPDSSFRSFAVYDSFIPALLSTADAIESHIGVWGREILSLRARVDALEAGGQLSGTSPKGNAHRARKRKAK